MYMPLHPRDDKKGKPEDKTGSLLIAAHINAIRTILLYQKLKIRQRIVSLGLVPDRDKTVNYIISEGSNLAQKEHESRYDWVGMVMHWERYKKNKISSYFQRVYAQTRICSRIFFRTLRIKRITQT